MEAPPEDEDLILSITPDVMKCLEHSGFFEKLDDLLSPDDASQPRQLCGGNYKLAESVLVSSGFKRTDLADIFGALRSKGGFCDCEILYNVAESSRLKAKYWRREVAKQDERMRHDSGSRDV